MIMGSETVQAPQPSPRRIDAAIAQQTRRLQLPARLWILLGVLAAECLALAQLPHSWFHPQQPMAAPIVFVATLLFFGLRQFQSFGEPFEAFSLRFLVVHLLALCLVAVSEAVLLGANHSPAFTRAAIAAWFLALLAVFASLVLTFIAPRRLVHLVKGLGAAWAYAAITTLAAMSARMLASIVWDAPDSAMGGALQTAAFHGVHALLGWFYSPVLTDPSRAIIGTNNFQVLIAGTCSGIEGLALMLVVAAGWLFFARRELRWQRAVWLVPIALGAIWILNLIRIAALIAIGDAGHAELALNGFHSEAGWIFFNAVAIGFLMAAQNIAWLRKPSAIAVERNASSSGERALAEAYLMPFLAITATSLVTRALSSGFEMLYPLRLVVGLIVLWHFRAMYRKIDWRMSWLGPAAGGFVFVVWIAASHFTAPTAAAVFAADNLAAGLDFLAPWQRVLWLAARVLAAVIVVPLAEELAFRGYLARRVVSAEVATVPYARLGTVAVLTSAVAYGLMGGRMFLAGTLAGIVFALVARARNRLGEAVVAHATANLLLAAWVLFRGDYLLW